MESKVEALARGVIREITEKFITEMTVHFPGRFGSLLHSITAEVVTIRLFDRPETRQRVLEVTIG
jgi:hypothetical protein